MKKIIIYALSFILISLLIGCNEWMDLKPEDAELESEYVDSLVHIDRLINASYQSLQGVVGGAFQRYSDLLADDVIPKDETDKRLNIYARFSTGYFTGDDAYSDAYVTIARANFAMEHIGDAVDVTDNQRNRVIAECKFLRAISHFAVVRLFAQPYGYTSDNSHYGIMLKTKTEIEPQVRTSVKDAYHIILEDLNDAESKMNNSREGFANEWAVKSLLAEVYFHMHDYDKAFEYADDVIDNGGFVFDNDVNAKFQLGGSGESILRLISTDGQSNAGEDYGVYKSLADQNPNIRISKEFYLVALRNANDIRKQWYEVREKGTPNEYIALTKYNYDYFDPPVFHLTYMMFLRAEAAILKSNPDVAAAVADVNMIKQRAYGSDSFNLPLDAAGEDVLNELRIEKRLELICEGYRVHDLKSRGVSEDPDLVVRGVPWNYPGMVLQFPISEGSDQFPYNPEPGS